MARLIRPPERRFARPIGVLAIAVGISLLVIAGLSSRPSEQSVDLAQVAPSTSETVLGEVIEQTTLPEAPPAEAAGFTTTTSESDEPAVSPATAPPPPDTSPTIIPPVSITNPNPPTTTTTRPPTTTTTSTTSSTTTTSTTTCNPEFELC
jgi:hypothetical protein